MLSLRGCEERIQLMLLHGVRLKWDVVVDKARWRSSFDMEKIGLPVSLLD